MPRKRHEPTPEQRRYAESASGYGCPEADIATIIGIDAKTLRKYYRAELDQGIAKANAQIGQSLYNFAVGREARYDDQGRLLMPAVLPDRSVAIFLGKVRLGMKETAVHEHVGKDGDRTITFEVLPAESGVQVPSQARARSRGPE